MSFFSQFEWLNAHDAPINWTAESETDREGNLRAQNGVILQCEMIVAYSGWFTLATSSSALIGC